MANQAMKCVHCGSGMTTKTENHHYTGSGLMNVVLIGMKVSRCRKCKAVEVAIPAVEKLHSMLAGMIADTTAKLLPVEIRFLRKHLGWSSVRFAKKMGIDRSTVHRWETGEIEMPMPAQRLLRVLVRQENPIDDFQGNVDLENLGIDEPMVQPLEARMRNGSWLPTAGRRHRHGAMC